ncbi:hypothetical protein [Legionella israelensis]|uniref:hypothetical protein n=1 Tax=Legionella israelensis TaxID=454 RepID=UPI00163D4FEE|nr:hypothetical protein [Legionella israelensis]
MKIIPIMHFILIRINFSSAGSSINMTQTGILITIDDIYDFLSTTWPKQKQLIFIPGKLNYGIDHDFNPQITCPIAMRIIWLVQHNEAATAVLMITIKVPSAHLLLIS